MSSNVVLKALGLNYSPNQLDTADGSLVEASNVNIRRDNAIEPRRGFKLDGDSFGTTDDRLKQLFVYKDRILRQYASTLNLKVEQITTELESFLTSVELMQKPKQDFALKVLKPMVTSILHRAMELKRSPQQMHHNLVLLLAILQRPEELKQLTLKQT